MRQGWEMGQETLPTSPSGCSAGQVLLCLLSFLHCHSDSRRSKSNLKQGLSLQLGQKGGCGGTTLAVLFPLCASAQGRNRLCPLLPPTGLVAGPCLLQPWDGERGPSEEKQTPRYSNTLHLQTVPTVHLVSYTQSNIVHRQNPGSLPEYREDRCCLVTGSTLAH